MPLPPGSRRISVTYNPDNAFITPDVPLQKESDPTQAHELARILDVLGMHSYKGVVFVGQQSSYFLDDTDNIIAGYDAAPFNTLNDAYVAANSRFGTPSSGAPVAVLLIGANTVETQSVQLCSNYVDIFGLAGSTVTGATGLPVFTACQGSGMTIQGVNFVTNAAPVLEVPLSTPLTDGAFFDECTFGNVGALPVPSGLFDVHLSMNSPIDLANCQVNLNAPLLYFDANSNVDPFLMALKDTTIYVSPSASTVFQGLSYLGVKMVNCTLVLQTAAASLFSCYSNGGTTFTDIDGLLIRSGVRGMTYPIKLITTARFNNIKWIKIDSQAPLIINPSTFTDSSFTGDFRNSVYPKLSLSNSTMTLDGLRMLNCSGDTYFTVAAVTPATEFTNIKTFTPLSSVSDTSALISSAGAVGGKFFNCNLTYNLHYAQTGGIFCGIVIGGSSYGIDNLACLGNPIRQCVLRGHSLLAQKFFTNNLVSSIVYPDVNLAGVITNDLNIPILIQDVKSQGVIDAPIFDLSQTPDRYCYITNSAFTAHDNYTQPWFPSIPPIDNPQADQRVFISGGARLPTEDTNTRDGGLRSVTYVQQIANRFGPLYLGSLDQTTVLQGSAFAVSNPRAFREAMNINYTTLYARISGGLTTLQVTNPNFNSWTVFSFVAEAGLDYRHLSIVDTALPLVYTYIGNNTIQLSLPEPHLELEWIDFVLSSLNSQEDASTPAPVSTLDVSQVGRVSIPLGVTQFAVAFNPTFTTVPIVVPSVSLPAGQPEIDWWVTDSSVNAYGFTVNLRTALTTTGYFLNFIAATTN